MTIIVIAEMFGIAGRREELLEVFAAAERDALGRDGCIRYTFAASLTEADRYVSVAEWRDEAALDAHYASAAFQDFQFSLDGLLARPTEAVMYTVSATARPLASRPMDPRDAD